MVSRWGHAGVETKKKKHREEHYAKMEAELEICYHKPRTAEEYWKPPPARRKVWNGFSLRAYRRNKPWRQFDFRLLASHIVKV